MMYTYRRPILTYLPFDYHIIPPKVRKWLFMRKSRFKNLPKEWYIDTAAIDLIPKLPCWPYDKKFAIVLTHDVDTTKGLLNCNDVTTLEQKYGLKSCLYMLGSGYGIKWESILYEDLIKIGFEIGLHGYNHDGKLAYLNTLEIENRIVLLPQRHGFRSPAYLRTLRLMKVVAEYFEYDSSIPDIGLFPYKNGCQMVFPFIIYKKLVELPVTMPPDGTLLALGHSPQEILDIWIYKYEWIKQVGGLVNLNTHPEPHMSGNAEMLDIYGKFLVHIVQDKDAWFALPKEVAKWWKQKAK